MPQYQSQVEKAIQTLEQYGCYIPATQTEDWEAFTEALQTLTNELERLQKLSLPADDWSNAPEWATHKATDKDGAMYWFDHKPLPGVEAWWSTEGNNIHGPACINPATYCKHWRDSVEERPK
jgi:cysteine synthase